ncbi:unnamed protein product [Moneuplotes crassus]|uniref:Uncharacterized protein n=1 Tax=Euplotes crassus TaxID=5936 RepID=A0AAD1XDX4_EUPCR|nr:unnamed protein product [Moneuplotes crassus]
MEKLDIDIEELIEEKQLFPILLNFSSKTLKIDKSDNEDKKFTVSYIELNDKETKYQISDSLEIIGLYLIYSLCHRNKTSQANLLCQLIGFQEEDKEDFYLNESCILEHTNKFFDQEDRLLSFVLTHPFTVTEQMYSNYNYHGYMSAYYPPMSTSKTIRHTYYIKVCENGSPTTLKIYVLCKETNHLESTDLKLSDNFEILPEYKDQFSGVESIIQHIEEIVRTKHNRENNQSWGGGAYPYNPYCYSCHGTGVCQNCNNTFPFNPHMSYSASNNPSSYPANLPPPPQYQTPPPNQIPQNPPLQTPPPQIPYSPPLQTSQQSPQETPLPTPTQLPTQSPPRSHLTDLLQ